MDKLSAPRYMMPMIASSCQHCDEQHVQTLTVMCTLHDFLSSKVRFIHTSTVTRQHSCPGKKYSYVSRASCYAYNASMPFANISIPVLS